MLRHGFNVAIVFCPSWPAREGPGQPRVVISCLPKFVSMSLADVCLGAGKKCRTHLHAAGTQGKCCRDAPSVSDAAGCDDGDVDRVNNLGNKRHRARSKVLEGDIECAAMAACFPTLSDDGIDAGVREHSRFGNCGGGANDHTANILQRPDHVERWKSEVKARDFWAYVQQH